jgi:phage-related protein
MRYICSYSMKREIILYKHYYRDFYSSQDERTRKKIDYVLNIVRMMDRVPEQYLKHLEGTDGLYEARVQLVSNIYRIICFFDKGNIVVLMNGFQKKTQKTPKNEIELAERLKKEYYEEK